MVRNVGNFRERQKKRWKLEIGLNAFKLGLVGVLYGGCFCFGWCCAGLSKRLTWDRYNGTKKDASEKKRTKEIGEKDRKKNFIENCNCLKDRSL